MDGGGGNKRQEPNKIDKISPTAALSQKLISPNLVQSVRCPSPVVHNVESNVLSPADSRRSFDAATARDESAAEAHQVPNVRTPPPPPPRWAKPGFTQTQSNFSVTTTVTFNVNNQSNDNSQASQVNKIISKNLNSYFF